MRQKNHNTKGSTSAKTGRPTLEALEDRMLLSFSPATNFPAGNCPTRLATGILRTPTTFIDLVATNPCNNKVTVMLGKPNGTLGAPVEYAVGTTPVDVAIADLNGDGHQDIITANAGSEYLSLLYGKGRGRFINAVNIPIYKPATSVELGDYDNDGDVDIAFASYAACGVVGTGAYAVILINNANGTFSQGPAPNVYCASGGPGLPNDLVFRDFDLDGDRDMAVSGNGGVYVLLQQPSNSFQLSASYSVSGAGLMTPADMNQDGKLDLLVRSTDQIQVLLGIGDGTFIMPVPTSTDVGSNPQQTAVADFDLDGIPDFVVSKYGPDTLGEYDNVFGNGYVYDHPDPDYPVGVNPVGVLTADFNYDTCPDVAVANSGSGNVSLLLHTCSPTPAPDSGLPAFDSEGVQLRLASETKITPAVTKVLPPTSRSKDPVCIEPDDKFSAANSLHAAFTVSTKRVVRAPLLLDLAQETENLWD